MTGEVPLSLDAKYILKHEHGCCYGLSDVCPPVHMSKPYPPPAPATVMVFGGGTFGCSLGLDEVMRVRVL